MPSTSVVPRGLGVAAAALLPVVLVACEPDEVEYVQVNEDGNCLSLRITSADDCAEEEATAVADVTCCGGEVIGTVTATPGCGAVGDDVSLWVELETDEAQIDLSEIARVSVTVPNDGTDLTEFDLDQSDLQENLWEIVLGTGSLGGTDRTDELCIRVWEVEESGGEEE